MQKKYALILCAALSIPAELSAGKLAVFSDPSGAEIILNSIRTGRFTPDTIENLPDNKITVSLLHKQYQYNELPITPREDSLISVSFHHLKEFDPLTITGSQGFGVLQLPSPPLESPWLLNELIEDRNSVVIRAGTHRVQWDGGLAYEPIDTFIDVPQGAIISPEIEFSHRYGRVNIFTTPENAAIYIDSTLWGIGRVRKPLTAGTHQLKVSADGFISEKREFLLFPNQNFRDSILLALSPDRDGDGFNDTNDVCPDNRGIYDGCPKVQKGKELHRIGSHLWNTFTDAPFMIEFAPVSFQKRIPVLGAIPDSVRLQTESAITFPEIISLYNDGAPLLNNYQGVQLANKLWISKSLFIGSIDFGYSVGGLKYKKPWKIPLDSDTIQYVEYSSRNPVNPKLSIQTTCFQIGFQLRGDPFVFSLMTGYASEKITFDGVSEIDTTTGKTHIVSEVYDNDFWNTTARVAATFKKAPFVPELYTEISFGPNRRENAVTGWIDTRIGVIVPWWRVK